MLSQNAPITNGVVYTPAASGMYTASVYVVPSSTAGAQTAVTVRLSWYDGIAPAKDLDLPPLDMTNDTAYVAASQVLYLGAGQPLYYSTIISTQGDPGLFDLFISLVPLN
jgi:hypothetical protein